MKIAIAGGGTGGHIYPGLAVVQRLQKMGHNAFWLGRDKGLEKKLVTDVPLCAISARPLRAKGFLQQILALAALGRGIWDSVGHLRRLRVDVLLSFGGYVSVAPAIASALLGIPVVCFEQNTRIGLANRLIAKLATTHLAGLPMNDQRFQEVGNPLREEIMALQPKAEQPNLLIFGGSQGASVLANELLEKCVTSFPGLKITCIVGGGNIKDIHRKLAKNPNVTIIEYADRIEKLYATSPLVISRAGAMAVSEIQYLGLSAIYFPLVHSADNHQYHNAMSQAILGARVFTDHEIDKSIESISSWLSGEWKVSSEVRTDSVEVIIMRLGEACGYKRAVGGVGE